MGFALNSFGKPVYTDAADPVPDLQAAVDFAYLFAYSRSGTAADRGNLLTGQLRDGMQFFETDTSIIYRRIAGAWKPWDSDWIAYTATLTNFTVGTSAQVAKTEYRYVAGMVEVAFTFVFGGSGTGAITGAPRFTLPVTAAALEYQYQQEGFAQYRRATAAWPGASVLFSTTQAQLSVTTGGAFTDPASANPWAAPLAAGDSMRGRLTYKPA